MPVASTHTHFTQKTHTHITHRLRHDLHIGFGDRRKEIDDGMMRCKGKVVQVQVRKLRRTHGEPVPHGDLY